MSIRFSCTGALLAAALATGCAVVPVPASAPVASGEIYAPVAPPPPQYEVVPAVPFPGAVWIGGYWNWEGRRHVWVPGRYVRPRPGYHWQASRWVQRPNGSWSLRAGGWVR
ncbi:MAG: hypothetical protein OZ923_05580 [Comamonadaceae bacterium]|nr:hypothetical protein [Burkholderiales bacterium]MEB2348062.1 hypothetical protein [Comamonadaceae bacterium]